MSRGTFPTSIAISTILMSICRHLRLAVLFLVALPCAGLLHLASSQAEQPDNVQTVLDRLRAQGEPISIADLGANRPAPETNASTYLRQAQDACREIDDAMGDFWERQGSSDEALEAALQAVVSGQIQQVEEAPQASEETVEVQEDLEYSEAAIEVYTKAFAAHPKVYDLLQQAASCPSYFLDLNYHPKSAIDLIGEMLEEIQESRSAIRVLKYRTIMLMSEGKHEEAFQTCLTAFRLCKLFDQTPFFIGQLISMGCRAEAVDLTNHVLRSGPVSLDSHKQLEVELAQVHPGSAFRNALRSERAFGMDACREEALANGKGEPAVASVRIECLALYDVLIANATKSYYDEAANAQFQASLKKLGPTAKELESSFEGMNVAVARSEAQLRCLRILNALLSRPRDEQTDVKLSERDLSEGTTTDPFNGQPLHLKHTDDGWVIYSVGQNLHDDGGQLDDEGTDVGLGPIVAP